MKFSEVPAHNYFAPINPDSRSPILYKGEIGEICEVPRSRYRNPIPYKEELMPDTEVQILFFL